MSKTTVSMRLEEGLLQKADEAVESGRYESRTQIFELGAVRELGMETEIRAIEDDAVIHLGLTPVGFLRGLIADWKARQVAFEQAWGQKNPEPLHEFARIAGGETAPQLIERLAAHHRERELQRRYIPLAAEARVRGLVPPNANIDGFSDILIGQLYDQVKKGVLSEADLKEQLDNAPKFKWTASGEPAKSLSDLNN